MLPDDDTALIVLASDTRVRLEEIMETFVDALVTEEMLPALTLEPGRAVE